MADFYVWKASELGLDISEMDKEHQELVAKMNALYKGVEEEQSTERLKYLIEELAKYTVKHFADEEAYMEQIGFPNLVTHRIIHEQLLKKFNEHVNDFVRTEKIKPAFFDFLKVWLTAHIRGIDMKYSDFKKTGKIAA